jgi:hypothetical protein
MEQWNVGTMESWVTKLEKLYLIFPGSFSSVVPLFKYSSGGEV